MAAQAHGGSLAARDPRGSLSQKLWTRLSGAWLRLRAGGLGTALSRLFESQRFAGGQGQLFSPRVVALDARLLRPLRAAGCQAQLVDPGTLVPPVPVSVHDRADALCLRSLKAVRGDELAEHAERVRPGGLVVVCTPTGPTGGARTQRWQIAAAFLHAGLADVVQIVAGRYVVTAGQVPSALPETPNPPDP